MIVEKQMECRLAGETEVLGRKPAPAPLLSIKKSHMTRPGFEPGPPRWFISLTMPHNIMYFTGLPKTFYVTNNRKEDRHYSLLRYQQDLLF
jgi:hypothetical protein